MCLTPQASTACSHNDQSIKMIQQQAKCAVAEPTAPVMPSDASCECRCEKNFIGSCGTPIPPSTCRHSVSQTFPQFSGVQGQVSMWLHHMCIRTIGRGQVGR
jgi:hypothetical protein